MAVRPCSAQPRFPQHKQLSVTGRPEVFITDLLRAEPLTEAPGAWFGGRQACMPRDASSSSAHTWHAPQIRPRSRQYSACMGLAITTSPYIVTPTSQSWRPVQHGDIGVLCARTGHTWEACAFRRRRAARLSGSGPISSQASRISCAGVPGGCCASFASSLSGNTHWGPAGRTPLALVKTEAEQYDTCQSCARITILTG